MKKIKNSTKIDYYTERVVAFVDILGFSAHIKETTEDTDKANNLHQALNSILSWQIDNEGDLGLKDIGREITVFSDSMVISYPIDYKGGLFHILLDLIHLQIQLICYGILLRGGIAIGKIYHDGKIVYGPAMIEAYKLENEEAKNPRIIITEESLKMGIIKTQPAQNSLQEEYRYIEGLVSKDIDGYYFLDILRQDSELTNSGEEYYNWLLEVRKLIIEQMIINEGNIRVLEKYKWLRDYFNEVVNDKNSYYPIPPGGGKGFRKLYKDLEIINISN